MISSRFISLHPSIGLGIFTDLLQKVNSFSVLDLKILKKKLTLIPAKLA
jgi:hypothetical protein